jgi:hypothetical protein
MDDATLGIKNPNADGVRIRIIGGFAGEQELRVGPGSVGLTRVSHGRYRIRYQFERASQVFEGDGFDVGQGSMVTITLQRVAGGNYGSRGVSGPL